MQLLLLLYFSEREKFKDEKKNQSLKLKLKKNLTTKN